MKINILYFAQVRHAAGLDQESVELPDNATLKEAIHAAAAIHGPDFRALLCQQDGSLQPSVLFLVNGTPVRRQPDKPLRDGDTLTIMTPMSGG